MSKVHALNELLEHARLSDKELRFRDELAVNPAIGGNFARRFQLIRRQPWLRRNQ